MRNESGNEVALAAEQGPWPGVAEPHRLLAEVTEWLSGYGNAATRRTYAQGLGLPTSPADLREWLRTPGDPARSDREAAARTAASHEDVAPTPGRETTGATTEATGAATGAASAPAAGAMTGRASWAATGPMTGPMSGPAGWETGWERANDAGNDAADWARTWAEAVASYAAVLGATVAPKEVRTPPPAARGRFRALHWFRWCASRGVDPLAATSTQVKAWLADLGDAGAASATRDRMLATVKALYTHLADTGLAAGNPAALNRRRLGLGATTASTTTTVVLTTAQVRALFDTAGTQRRGASPLDTARARAVVGLFTLGLRVSELCDLDRADLHVTRGRRALRVQGKGGKTRVVYLHEAAERALADYLRLREANSTETSLARPGRASGPLLVTRTGGRYRRQAVWQLLRRLATAAGEPLRDVAGAMHPHALRHFYVTTAVEAGAQLVHVQADVGHTSVDTTEQVYNNAARDPSRSAVDLVGDVLGDR